MSAIRRLFWDLLLIWLQINAHASVSWSDEAGWDPRGCALQACRRSEEPSSPSTVKSCLMASWQWQHPTTRLGLVQTGRMSLIPSGLRAFLLDPTSSAVIHAARLGEKMFSFSSTHGGGSFASTSVCSQKNPTPGGAPGLFSSATPNFHPKRWCNPLQTILSHGTNRLCAAILFSACGNTDSHSSPIPQLPLSPSPTRLSGIQKMIQCLFNGISVILQTPGSPIWPRTHWRPSLMASEHGCDLSGNKKLSSPH